MRQLLPRPRGRTQLDPEGNGAGLCCGARLRTAMDLLDVEQLVQFHIFDYRGLVLSSQKHPGQSPRNGC